MNNKQSNDLKRTEVINKLIDIFKGDEDILQVATNKVAYPFTNSLNNEEWIEITISVPLGARDGSGYDGYEQSEMFIQKEEEKAKKEEEKKKEREKKKLRDKKRREEEKERKKKEKTKYKNSREILLLPTLL